MSTADDRRRAAELRLAGVGYEQIAQQLNLASGVEAQRLAQEALQASLQDPLPDVVRLELERLDALLVGLWGKARRGDVAAADRVLKLMDRRARYLGIDAGLPAAEDDEPRGTPLDELNARRAARGADPSREERPAR